MTTDNTKTHTDIKSDGWIARLPAFMRPYALLARLDRPVGIWLLLLPGWWALMLSTGGVWRLNGEDIKLLLLFGLGAVVMRAAGCVLNDIYDRDLDAVVARTKSRPLASGAVSRAQAFIFLAVLLLTGAVVLFQMNFVAVLLGFLSLPLIALYPLMKRITWWPQLFLGVTFNFGALIGWAAATGTVGVPALLLYMGAIFWTLGYDTIYAHQDKDDDQLAGIKSTALKLGARSKTFVAIVYGVAFVFIALAFVMGGAGILSYLLLILPALHLAGQIKRWDEHDAQSCLQLFRSNRDFALLVLLAACV